MSKIPNNKKLILINIPGTHDSACYTTNRLGTIFAQTQNIDIESQLKLGVRLLDIRIREEKSLCCSRNQTDNNLICCHGICDCYISPDFLNNDKLSFKLVIETVKKFIKQNPTETVILLIKSEKGDSYNNLMNGINILYKIADEYVVKFDKKLTLGECRGKIVTTTFILNEIDDEGRLSINNKINETTNIEEIHKKYADYASFKVTGSLKIKEVDEMFNSNKMSFIEAEELNSAKLKNFPIFIPISCTGEDDEFIPNPKKQADIANKFLLEYNFLKKNYYGWIKFDFINENLTKKIIETNF